MTNEYDYKIEDSDKLFPQNKVHPFVEPESELDTLTQNSSNENAYPVNLNQLKAKLKKVHPKQKQKSEL